MSKLAAMITGTTALLALAAGASGQAKKGGILQPGMTVENGSYDKPMGKLGAKPPAQKWSATTFGASVDGKPNPGAKDTTVVGEIIDFSCYLQIGKHGEKHRSCAQKCFTNGQPIGLLAKDGTVYMLMEEEHDPRRDGLTNLRQTASDHAGHIMEVTGTEWSLNGYKAIFVHGLMKK
jgi:hypothetical protein